MTPSPDADAVREASADPEATAGHFFDGKGHSSGQASPSWLDRRQPGLEPDDENPRNRQGRDPRNMPLADLRALGHERVSPIRAIRLKCVDCCGGAAVEVRRCPSTDCPLWPFRMGKNVWFGKADQKNEEPTDE